MRTLSADDIKRVVSGMIQPLYRGAFSSVNGFKATLTEIIPFGSGSNFQHASPFGFISYPVKGVTAYVLNLFGSAVAPVILAHLHQKRPVPSAPGEVVVYCTSPDGAQVPIKLRLKNDGTLQISAATKIQLICDNVEVGSGALEKVLNGETFQTFFNDHVHEGNLGVPTGKPIVPSDASHLSAKVKAAK